MQPYPLHSLIEGSWFKLICGASYQHLPVVRSLALAYSLAGADCIDVAADPAVISAAQEGIITAEKIKAELPDNSKAASKLNTLPWLMVSVNDGEDPHFRKAKFDVTQCPIDCPQPCVAVCPAEAIDLNTDGVLDRLCYGCGRCVPICPQELITTHAYQSSLKEVLPWLESGLVDAIEIHTQVGHYEDFKQVWQSLQPIVGRLKLLAISCTDADNAIEYLRSLYELVSPLPCPLLWQTDGRSMSGDIGKGTTHAAIAFAQKVLEAKLPGYIQLAGGTNDYTVAKLKQSNMLRQENSVPANFVSGVAYGSYARAVLSPILNRLEVTELPANKINLVTPQPMKPSNLKLEQNQLLLEQAITTASQLVNQIKEQSNHYKL